MADVSLRGVSKFFGETEALVDFTLHIADG